MFAQDTGLLIVTVACVAFSALPALVARHPVAKWVAGSLALVLACFAAVLGATSAVAFDALSYLPVLAAVWFLQCALGAAGVGLVFVHVLAANRRTTA